ncbi:hypothetical protein H257_12791 [Aphanomyces astaci]|uniref:Uncharacterized protein n=1 Tax=Aphanomyces astaci TaxID=112090 RepID=W4FZ66_APHAT|nr:hypothetical protein H257_12791 [Aphanomyces astaci]ETV71978.1 hypothetical protein H257_12791 [Aphanomyces astaci]|eukprot:XP_009838421.1 hypothetical protein H257_12791 [Aphanomyces astaci]
MDEEEECGTFLEMRDIQFRSQTSPFHVRVETTDDDVPFTLRVEHKETKHQWTGTVKDTSEYTPKDASYVLPSFVVVAALLTGLPACRVPNHKEPGIDLDLINEGETTGLMYMVLRMKAFGVFEAEYQFPLKPVEMTRATKAESKLRDLYERVDQLQTNVNAVQLTIQQLYTELDEFRNHMRS